MKTFDTLNEFIHYYNQKQKIPSEICLNINGKEHIFKKGGINNLRHIQKLQYDTYSFYSNDMNGLEVEFQVTYYRYYELKIILEAFFTYYPDDGGDFLCPVYFYERFIEKKDFEPYKAGLSESLEKQTGLQWVNTRLCINAFQSIREEAYINSRKDLFYQLLLQLEDDDDPCLEYYNNNVRKNKWKIDEEGKSLYFDTPLEIPDYW
jgi:hypothetical protein